MYKPAALDLSSGLVERARALAPLIAKQADEIEGTRRLTQPVVAALIENGLYRALLPKTFGGAEAPPEVFMQMLEEIAKADASTAWCRRLRRPGHGPQASSPGANRWQSPSAR